MPSAAPSGRNVAAAPWLGTPTGSEVGDRGLRSGITSTPGTVILTQRHDLAAPATHRLPGERLGAVDHHLIARQVGQAGVVPGSSPLLS